jgi:hypothetical protein
VIISCRVMKVIRNRRALTTRDLAPNNPSVQSNLLIPEYVYMTYRMIMITDYLPLYSLLK